MSLRWKFLLSATVPLDPTTGDFDWGCVPLPAYASLKYDGYRVGVQGGVLVSRNGLPVRNRELQARYGRPEYEGLDGELVDGPPNAPGAFGRTSSVVKRADADASQTKLYVVDWYGDLPYSQRISLTQEAHGFRAREGVQIIKQRRCKTIAQVQEFERKAVEAGWEGVMLRRADQGPYPQKPGKENRSTLREFYLARLKRFEHSDAVLLAVHPLGHNLNEERTAAGARSSKKAGRVLDSEGRVGSATMRDVATGVEFDTTIGAERLRAYKGWSEALGKTFRYKWQVCGTKDKPRINSCAFEELGL